MKSSTVYRKAAEWEFKQSHSHLIAYSCLQVEFSGGAHSKRLKELAGWLGGPYSDSGTRNQQGAVLFLLLLAEIAKSEGK